MSGRIIITKSSEGVMIDAKIDLSPHEARHLVYKLMNTLCKGLLRSHPEQTMVQAWEAVAEGLACAIESQDNYCIDVPRKLDG